MSMFDPPTHSEALASAENLAAEARRRFDDAKERLHRVRRHGRDPRAALLAWNLARNELDHRVQQLAWWRRRLAERPAPADRSILECRKRGAAAVPPAKDRLSGAKPAPDVNERPRAPANAEPDVPDVALPGAMTAN